jgi:phage N-6-adenine-methyltransferase
MEMVNINESGIQTPAVPTLAEMIRAGRISADKIKRASKDALLEWFAQSERLNIARSHYKLRGDRFVDFAKRIGVDRSSAFELVKLHLHRVAILDRCLDLQRGSGRGSAFVYPGWENALGWFKASTEDYVASDYEPRIRPAHFQPPSEKTDEWGTPQALFNHYHRIHRFTIDVAASASLAKCKRYYSRKDDGLRQEWSGIAWMNPPYSLISAFCKKAHESAKAGTVVVALLPAFTDSAWFHNHGSHAEIELLKRRLNFVGGYGYAPYAHMIAVWRRKSARRGDRLSITVSDRQFKT